MFAPIRLPDAAARGAVPSERSDAPLAFLARQKEPGVAFAYLGPVVDQSSENFVSFLFEFRQCKLTGTQFILHLVITVLYVQYGKTRHEARDDS